MYRASFTGDIDEVKKLLEGGANVDEQNNVSRIVLVTVSDLSVKIVGAGSYARSEPSLA